MSIIGDNVIARLNYCHREVGRKFKSTKQYHQWEFSLNGTYHKIELFHSFITGRKKLVVDGDYVLKGDSYFSDFKFEFEIDNIIAEIKQKKLNEYELYICGKSFDIMKQEEAQGINKEEVEKKIKELKKRNEYNKPNKNNKNKKYEEHDFEQEEEEEEEYENNQNNYNNNLRNDDDFYKSEGNNFDFSDTAFEKNKKILQNFDFFEDDDNNNKSNRNINNNRSDIRDNNFINNFQNLTRNNN